MVSQRLDDAIRDPVERTYLAAIDGVWADLVLAEFAFLEERGGSLDAIAFHQKGDYIRYCGPWGSVVLEFAPDNLTPWVGGHVELRGSGDSFVGELESLVQRRALTDRAPRPQTMNQASIEAWMRPWAEALRDATELF